MPIYDYKCKNPNCNMKYTVFYASIPKAVEEEPNEVCPKCDSKDKERKVATDTSFILKGNNWAKSNKTGKGGY